MKRTDYDPVRDGVGCSASFLSSRAGHACAPKRPYSYRKIWPHKLIRNLPRGPVKSFSQQVMSDPCRLELKDEFRITEQTQVRLNGHQCKYEDVPPDAVITHLEVDSEGNRAILRIHFRSKNGQ
jgi:hypothetical protein